MDGFNRAAGGLSKCVTRKLSLECQLASCMDKYYMAVPFNTLNSVLNTERSYVLVPLRDDI